MNLLYGALLLMLAVMLGLAGVTRVGSWMIERRHPPAGSFADIGGTRLHYVHLAAPTGADLPPIVFIHGASANLNDQRLPLGPLLEGRAEVLFLDRPGHGWSGRGSGNNETQEAQAQTIAALMRHVGIARAIIVGHSFGGSVAAAFALEHPEMTEGLLFLAAATHPWPGGRTSWYYRLAAIPLVGPLFSGTVAYPAGARRLPAAAECVFSPNRVPDSYTARAAIPLVLRPKSFRANAIDVESLFRFASRNAPRYRQIAAPAVIISGDSDTVVYEEIHSRGLARDIPGAELLWVRNLGHKPDWIAPDLVVAAIEKLSGRARDLQAMARRVEARIEDDGFGRERCVNEKPPTAELAPL
jgi:pimeloyl-ACP methyl ester carboxylesterase